MHTRPAARVLSYAISPFADLKYNPKSGNWDMISAGNPTTVWDTLMSQAKARDNSPFGRAQEVAMRKAENEQVSKSMKRGDKTQKLLQVDGVDVGGGGLGMRTHRARGRHHLELEKELKSLLQAKVAAGEESREEASGKDSMDEEGGDSNGPDMSDPITAWAYNFASRLRDAGHALEESSQGAGSLERLASKLHDRRHLKELCRYVHLPQAFAMPLNVACSSTKE